jgi:hypothetical protein
MEIKLTLTGPEIVSIFGEQATNAFRPVKFSINGVGKSFVVMSSSSSASSNYPFIHHTLQFEEVNIVEQPTPQELAAQAAVKSAEDTLKKAKETLNKIQEKQ